MTKRFGFTLAEVLITLGIIGVVAAMTMPTLMNQTNGAQYKAAYKKALSALSQAVTLNVALDDFNFADIDSVDGDKSVYKMLKNRMNVAREEQGAVDGYALTAAASGKGGAKVAPAVPGDSGNTTLFFNDGIMFTYDNTDSACTEADPCYGFIDVNGTKAPNKEVVCDGNVADGTDTCTVKSPTDIYPVKFFDQSVLPTSVAAKAVLYGK